MEPYTIRIFVQDGDPEGIRIVEKMNWTGLCVTFPRDKWKEVRSQSEVQSPGVYVLQGYDDEADLPEIYIGQAEDITKRIDSHIKSKDFWDKAVVFVSSNDALNRAHISFIESKLVELANKYKQSVVHNGTEPRELTLSRSEKSDTESFLKEMLSIYPLLGVRAFEEPKVVAKVKDTKVEEKGSDSLNTIIVPAREEGFKRVFLGENSWYAIRIAAGKLDDIKYIAAYQSAPVSAVTHYAEVDTIESFSDSGKYKLIFKEPATKLAKPIEIADAPSGSMQGPRYISFKKLSSAQKVMDLF